MVSVSLALSRHFSSRTAIRLGKLLALTSVLAAVTVIAADTQQTPMGCVWEVTGLWTVGLQKSAVKAGDLIAPGTLVTGQEDAAESLIVLMPDGQRLLLDCHDKATCARGFRLPALTQSVAPETIATFQQIGALRRRAVDSATDSKSIPVEVAFLPVHPRPALLRNEAVVSIAQDGSVNVAAAITSLPPADYRLEVKNNHRSSEQAIRWDGTGSPLKLQLTNLGLYRLSFYGSLKKERMASYVLAVSPTRYEAVSEQLEHWKNTLDQWNDTSPGWPIHDFLVLYLCSLSTNNN